MNHDTIVCCAEATAYDSQAVNWTNIMYMHVSMCTPECGLIVPSTHLEISSETNQKRGGGQGKKADDIIYPPLPTPNLLHRYIYHMDLYTYNLLH